MMKHLSFTIILCLLAVFLFALSSECYAESYAYIPNRAGNTVSVIDLSDNTVIKTIGVGGSPTGVATDVVGGYVYVTNYADDTVSVISILFNDETTRIDVGDGPLGVVASSDGTYVYVANSLDDTVSVIKGGSFLTDIDVGLNPTGIGVTASGAYVYVANNGDNTVTVISTEDEDGNEEFTIEETIDVDDLDLMEGPYGVALSPVGSYVYVTNNVSNTVSVISTSSNELSNTIDVDDDGLGEGPLGVAVSPNGAYVYVANNSSNTVSVIMTSDYSVVETVDVGAGPWGVDVIYGGHFVYVANSLDGTVSVISTEFDENDELSVTATVNVGTSPAGLGRFITGTVPEPPTDLTATSVSNSQIDLSWTDHSDDELGFRIERTIYGGVYQEIDVVDANVTSYSNTDLRSYTTYYYRVHAYNDAGDSDYTNQAYATTEEEESGCFISTVLNRPF
jgi:YVTN family beta-propeller protein